MDSQLLWIIKRDLANLAALLRRGSSRVELLRSAIAQLSSSQEARDLLADMDIEIEAVDYIFIAARKESITS